MRRLFYTLFIIIGCQAGMLSAQTSRTAYHQEGYVFGHELNPAFQPEEGYYSLPLLGNTSFSMQSTLDLGDLIYDRGDGRLTTFMSRGTISKPDLMDKVGSAFKNYEDVNLTLFSMGRRVNDERYQTLSVSVRGNVALRVDNSVFDLLKDVENGHYRLKDTRLETTTYAEIAVGESRKINDRLTVGAKAKLLVGMNRLTFSINRLDLDLKTDGWYVRGLVAMHTKGFGYKTKVKEYREKDRGQYMAVTGLNFPGIKPMGFGVAVDAGVTFRATENWTLSAAVRDLGILCWPDSKKAWNPGKTFSFDGIRDVCLKEPDEEYMDANEDKLSLRDRLDHIGDDLMQMAHLEKMRSDVQVHMLGATLHAGASYRTRHWTAGALFTSYILGNLTWVEGRMSVIYSPMKRLNFTVAPAYGSTGFSAGAMASFEWKNGVNLHIGSDALTFCFNPQMVPTNLRAALQIGMTFALRK